MELHRRQFLRTLAGAALGSALAPLMRTVGYAKPTARFKEFQFTASKTQLQLGEGPEFIAWTYNGRVPGPKIRVQEGDMVRVVLKNDLADPTTIHWHGIPLINSMDGVPGITQPAVQPGETFVYEFEARPSGSFLYHSHAGYQLDQGLYGSLVIEPSRTEESYDREFTLVLEDWVLRDGGGTAAVQRRPPMGGMHGRMHRGPSFGPAEGPLWEPIYDGYAVNGRVNDAIEALLVQKGDRVKIRLINACSATIFFLRLAGHSLTITHADGNPVRPVETDVVRIGMGERYDVMITADNPGNWFLAAYDSGLGEGRLRIPLLYQGVRRKQPQTPVFHRGLRMADYGDFQALKPTGYRNGEVDRFFNQSLSGGMHSSAWSINGQVYPYADPLIVRKGERVRLRYGNHSMMPHPMHLHGHFFRVVNRNLPPERWLLKDTLILDHMQRIDAEFVADNPGRWFHHCHNLYHMEAGMANVIEYADASNSVDF
jgi:FtsP/CotA-like multicopper oxidase with cupredoxin domain